MCSQLSLGSAAAGGQAPRVPAVPSRAVPCCRLRGQGTRSSPATPAPRGTRQRLRDPRAMGDLWGQGWPRVGEQGGVGCGCYGNRGSGDEGKEKGML